MAAYCLLKEAGQSTNIKNSQSAERKESCKTRQKKEKKQINKKEKRNKQFFSLNKAQFGINYKTDFYDKKKITFFNIYMFIGVT